MTGLRRLFLWALVASLSATALLAIAFLVFAEFDQTTLKVLSTTAMLSGFSLLGLPGGVLLDQGRAAPLGWTNIGLAGAGLSLGLVVLWAEPGNEDWAKLLGTLVVAGAASAQAAGTTVRRRADDRAALTYLYLAGLGLSAVLATLIVITIWAEIDSEGYIRLIGALAVAVVLTTLLQPILRRAAKPETAAEAFELVLATGDGGEVTRSVRSRDFAAAAADAIRSVEREGATVVRVERR